MDLFRLLCADVTRQRQFTGKAQTRVGGWDVLKALASPRFLPIALYRAAYACGRHRLRALGKVFSLINFIVFGMEIGIDVEIGPGLYFPHTLGIVLGATKIGRNAVIYHGVTVGAKEPDFAFNPEARPRIGDDAFLGSGAKVLGGITLGDRVVVAANAVVVRDVPDGCTVAGVPARIIKGAASAPGLGAAPCSI